MSSISSLGVVPSSLHAPTGIRPTPAAKAASQDTTGQTTTVTENSDGSTVTTTTGANGAVVSVTVTPAAHLAAARPTQINITA